MIGGKYALLTIMNNEDADSDSLITTLNTAVAVTAEILDMCDKRKELKKEKI